ncbi:hypothetical protein FCR2A7T_05680 [Flavobacterium cauense R2A-7]|uniref:Uncharacterized protein n=2 Tax=Flavobacterium TaxID=237 RepID=V6SAF4_9FLAO|nr:hypothetical protein [Flavobacterium cauense]ESU21395.1 hypothetical protein FCR2A7T_05680 [Flavobacterium cauense R2A-7]TWI08047.1 hypothetical protein IP98_02912 [Flavobacterium cauense R2A-7]
MKYNIYIKTRGGSRSILETEENETKKIVNAYKENKESIFLNGKKFFTGDLLDLQIYTFENNQFKTGQELYSYCDRNHFLERGYFSDPHVPKNILEQVGNNVTSQFINDSELEEIENETPKENYIDPKRIKELEGLKSKDFDLTRLTAVLKEINVAYKNNLKFAIPPLVRSIIDQVPPIFGKANFSDVCGSFGSKSFKDSMNILDKSSRKIADSYLHTHIRKNESSLPTETQINFKSDLDVLLQEVSRVIQNS